MLSPLSIPGLFITGTDTGVGKTVIAAAIANCLHRGGRRVAVCKPIATGCVHRREGLVSEDGEFLAHHADSPHPLDLICPQRYAEALAPAVAAARAKRPVDFGTIERALRLMSRDSDFMIVEGIGGVMVPLDEKHLVLDMIGWLGLPVIIVARAGLGTINHTLLTATALRDARAGVAGIIINRYPRDTPPLAEETSPKQIEKWSKLPILCLIPDCKTPLMPTLPPDITTPIDAVDWEQCLLTSRDREGAEPPSR